MSRGWQVYARGSCPSPCVAQVTGTIRAPSSRAVRALHRDARSVSLHQLQAELLLPCWGQWEIMMRKRPGNDPQIHAWVKWQFPGRRQGSLSGLPLPKGSCKSPSVQWFSEEAVARLSPSLPHLAPSKERRGPRAPSSCSASSGQARGIFSKGLGGFNQCFSAIYRTAGNSANGSCIWAPGRAAASLSTAHARRGSAWDHSPLPCGAKLTRLEAPKTMLSLRKAISSTRTRDIETAASLAQRR